MTHPPLFTVFAAFQSLVKRPPSMVLCVQQRTLPQNQKYQRHQTRENIIFSCRTSSPASLLYVRKRSLLRSEEDDDIWEGRHDDTPPRRRRKRKRRTGPESYTQQTIDDGNVPAQLLESSTRFLSQPATIPFVSDRARIPLAYPLSTLLAILIVPPVTWGLWVLLFGVYLSLGTALLAGGDSSVDFGSVENDNQEEYSDEYADEAGEDEGSLLPAAAFVGALASAALLSPQGLDVSGRESLLSLFPPTVALLAMGLGGFTIFMGIKELRDEEQRWEERDRRAGVVRSERRKMNRWDEEMEEKDQP